MQTMQTWTTVPPEVKEAWGDGPWRREPDKAVWVDAVTGFVCLAQRSYCFGSWCGYVGVPASHSLYGADRSEVLTRTGISLSYSDVDESGDVDVEDRLVGVWLFGFDCGHYNELSPATTVPGSIRSWQQYRTLEYVQAECTSLARQLASKDTARSDRHGSCSSRIEEISGNPDCRNR